MGKITEKIDKIIKTKEIGLVKIGRKLPLDAISPCRMLISMIGPNTIPRIIGVKGNFNFSNVNPMMPKRKSDQTSNILLFNAKAPTIHRTNITGNKYFLGVFNTNIKNRMPNIIMINIKIFAKNTDTKILFTKSGLY